VSTARYILPENSKSKHSALVLTAVRYL